MDPLAVLCLYSQYSTNCDMFIAKIKKNNIDFIQFIPLDTPYSRKMVASKIRKVPAVAVHYPNSLEIYEGAEAFTWLDEVVENKNKEDVNNALVEIQRQKQLLELEKSKIIQTPPEQPPTESKNNQPQPPSPSPPESFNELQLPPPPPPSSNKSTYTPIDDVVNENQADGGNETGTTKKLSASSRKTQDLLARARELEKGREDLSSRKPPFPLQ